MPRLAPFVACVVVSIVTLLLFAPPPELPPMTASTLPPRLLYRPLLRAVAALDALVQLVTPPNLLLFRHVMSYLHTVEIYVAADLGIADALAAGPLDADDLARRVSRCAEAPPTSAAGCRECALRLTRVMRALSAIGVFREVSPGVYENTATSACLRSGAPDSLRAAALNFGGVQYSMMASLPTTVLTGEASFLRAHAAPFWEFYQAHPSDHTVFDATMRELGALGGADATIAADFDWAGVASTVVDVGGGLGDMLAGILLSRPSLRGVIFDLAPVTARARARWARADAPACRARVAIVAGDVFDAATIPNRASAEAAIDAAAAAAAASHGASGRVERCDGSSGGVIAYALRDIIHDWPDEDVVRMLRALRRAMLPRWAGVVTAPLPDGARSARGARRRCYWVEWVVPGGAADASPPIFTSGEREATAADDLVATGGDTADSAAAPRPRDRVVLVTRLLYPGEGFIVSEGAADADVLMLGAFGTSAGERTLPHIESLLVAAGFELRGVTRVRGRYSIVHAEPLDVSMSDAPLPDASMRNLSIPAAGSRDGEAPSAGAEVNYEAQLSPTQRAVQQLGSQPPHAVSTSQQSQLSQPSHSLAASSPLPTGTAPDVAVRDAGDAGDTEAVGGDAGDREAVGDAVVLIPPHPAETDGVSLAGSAVAGADPSGHDAPLPSASCAGDEGAAVVLVAAMPRLVAAEPMPPPVSHQLELDVTVQGVESPVPGPSHAMAREAPRRRKGGKKAKGKAKAK